MEDITIIGSSDEDGSDIEMMEAPKSSPPRPRAHNDAVMWMIYHFVGPG